MTTIIRQRVLPPLPGGLRSPKRSTLEALEQLSGWVKSQTLTELVPAPDKPDKLIPSNWEGVKPDVVIKHYRQRLRWEGGWFLVEPNLVQPMPPTFLPTKNLSPILSSDRTRLTKVSLGGARIWIGQCTACNKFTLGISTYFLQGGSCLHCSQINGVPVEARGYQKFFAGSFPLQRKIYVLRAKDLTQAQALATTLGYAWVTSAHVPKAGKEIYLPDPTPRPDRPDNAWEFDAGDPPYEWEIASEIWQGPAGESRAWFTPPAYGTAADSKAAPPSVSFDDFM
jgi:hypothetical protein